MAKAKQLNHKNKNKNHLQTEEQYWTIRVKTVELSGIAHTQQVLEMGHQMIIKPIVENKFYVFFFGHIVFKLMNQLAQYAMRIVLSLTKWIWNGSVHVLMFVSSYRN